MRRNLVHEPFRLQLPVSAYVPLWPLEIGYVVGFKQDQVRPSCQPNELWTRAMDAKYIGVLI